mgnify:CR=1 FL=1
MRSAGINPTRTYAILGLISALALTIFVYLPVGLISVVPLAALGAPAFAQAVWNTSRIRELAAPAYQARLQAITSMAFTLGFSLGMLWAGLFSLGVILLLYLLPEAGRYQVLSQTRDDAAGEAFDPRVS